MIFSNRFLNVVNGIKNDRMIVIPVINMFAAIPVLPFEHKLYMMLNDAV